MKLRRVSRTGCEPDCESLFELPGRRGGQRFEIGGDRQVIAHRVALLRPAKIADINRAAVTVAADDGEAYFPPSERLEIDAHRNSGCRTVTVGIHQMQDRAPLIERRGFQPDPIVGGSERSFRRAEANIQIVGPVCREVKGEVRGLLALADQNADAGVPSGQS